MALSKLWITVPSVRSAVGGVVVLLFFFSELIEPSFALPITDLEVLSLIDPLEQFDEETEVKKVVVKSVFNVPVKIDNPCPSGSQRTRPEGPCVPKVQGIRLDDTFLLQSFAHFNRKKQNPNKRRRTSTPPPSTHPVPTYIIEEEKGSGVALDTGYRPQHYPPSSITNYETTTNWPEAINMEFVSENSSNLPPVTTTILPQIQSNYDEIEMTTEFNKIDSTPSTSNDLNSLETTSYQIHLIHSEQTELTKTNSTSLQISKLPPNITNTIKLQLESATTTEEGQEATIKSTPEFLELSQPIIVTNFNSTASPSTTTSPDTSMMKTHSKELPIDTWFHTKTTTTTESTQWQFPIEFESATPLSVGKTREDGNRITSSLLIFRHESPVIDLRSPGSRLFFPSQESEVRNLKFPTQQLPAAVGDNEQWPQTPSSNLHQTSLAT